MIRIGNFWINPAFIVMVSPTSNGGSVLHFSREAHLQPWTTPYSTVQILAAYSTAARQQAYDQAILEEVEHAARSMT